MKDIKFLVLDVDGTLTDGKIYVDDKDNSFKAFNVKDGFALVNWLKELNITFENVAYMGDDLNDLGVMKSVGFSACPKDSVQEVLEITNFISSKNGGDGAVREFLEHIMKKNGMWKKILEKYSNE